MTTVATIAGAVPGALALGPGGELRIPMSIAVIGGVIVSTVLTLFVVPCFYSIAEDWKGGLTRLFGIQPRAASLSPEAPTAERATLERP